MASDQAVIALWHLPLAAPGSVVPLITAEIPIGTLSKEDIDVPDVPFGNRNFHDLFNGAILLILGGRKTLVRRPEDGVTRQKGNIGLSVAIREIRDVSVVVASREGPL